MTITYENKDEDAIAWYHTYLTRTPTGKDAYRRWQSFVSFLTGLLAPFILFVVWRPHGAEWSYLFVLAIMMMVASYIALVRPKKRDVTRMARGLLKRGHFNQLLVPLTMTLSEEGLHATFPTGEVIRKWSTGQRWEETETHFHIFWSSNEFSQVPKRAFTTEYEMSLFRTQLEQYLLMAKGTVPVNNSAPATTGSRNWWRDRNNVDAGADSQKLRQENR